MSPLNANGGAAFPSQFVVKAGSFDPVKQMTVSEDQVYIQLGMSLRDWFAGQALAGLLANSEITEHPSYSRDGAVGEAFHIADAMLAAREAKP